MLGWAVLSWVVWLWVWLHYVRLGRFVLVLEWLDFLVILG